MRKIIIDNERNIGERTNICRLRRNDPRGRPHGVTLFLIFLLPSNCTNRNCKSGKADIRDALALIMTDCDKIISDNLISLEFT